MANPFKAHPRVNNTDGRVPTTTLPGQKEAEGNSSVRKGGSLGETSGAGDDAIERMTTRNAAGFRNDIVKRNSKIKSRRRGRACD
jgi:hypothetical protein